MSFLDEIPEAPVLEGELVPAERPGKASLAKKMLRDVAAEIVDDTTMVVQAALQFGAIDPEQTEPSEEWVEKYGMEKATERFRIAKYSLMSAKEAPVGLKMASQLATGIMKDQSAGKNVTNELHVAKLYITAPMPSYPELEVENDEG